MQILNVSELVCVFCLVSEVKQQAALSSVLDRGLEADLVRTCNCSLPSGRKRKKGE